MNFEDLKSQWETLDKKLETSLRLNVALLRQSSLDKTRSKLRRMALFVWLELLLDVPLVLLTGSFVANHFFQPAFLIPGLALHIMIIVLIGLCAHQLAVLHEVDYAAPVLTIQKKLEKIRISRIRATKWTFLLIPLIWIPFLIVILKGFLGVSLYAIASPAWLIANLLFGVAVIGFAVWFSKRYADRLSASPFVKRLMDDVAGNSLNQAVAFLATLSEFEDEQHEK